MPHSTTFVLCYTVFLSCKSVCKLCKTKKKNVRNSINTRNRDTFVFFFYVYQCLVIPATEGSQNFMTLTVTAVSMGQLRKHFKQFLNLFYLYFVCFYIFPATTVVSCPFKNLPQQTADKWILCAAFNAAIDLMHFTIENLKSRYLPILIYFTGI